jgi:hypothetical protein
MKTFLKVLVGIAVITVLGLSAAWFVTGGMSDVADEFFAAAREGDMVRAYTYVSDDFKAGTSEDQLADFLYDNALTDVTDTSWGNRSFDGNLGELSGSVSTGSGGVVPITLRFVKGDAGWRIYSIEKPASGLQEAAGQAQLPSETEMVELVAAANHYFILGVQQGSMRPLYDHISHLWQKQTSVEELDGVFKAFLDAELDLMVLDDMPPLFDGEPTLDENNLLVIKGHYNTSPDLVSFEHSFIREGLSWKLIGYRMDIQPPGN